MNGAVCLIRFSSAMNTTSLYAMTSLNINSTGAKSCWRNAYHTQPGAMFPGYHPYTGINLTMAIYGNSQYVVLPGHQYMDYSDD